MAGIITTVDQMWATLKESITAYTGLSPTTFFAGLFLATALYYAISGMFVSPPPRPKPREVEEEMEPLPPPVQLGEITEEELRVYDGSDSKKPLLMAIKGQIYDVTQSRMFYGPGGPYALFTGKDASRALAKMSFEEKDLTGDVSGLGPFEIEALQDWEYKFMSKYVKVGTIKKTVPVADAPAAGDSSEPTAEAAAAAENNGPLADAATKPTEDNGPTADAATEHAEESGPSDKLAEDAHPKEVTIEDNIVKE